MIEDTREPFDGCPDDHVRWDQVKDLLPELDWSQRKLATACGCSLTYINRLLNGDIKLGPLIAQRIEEVLEIVIVDKPVTMDQKFADVCHERDRLKALLVACLIDVRKVKRDDPPFYAFKWSGGEVDSSLWSYLEGDGLGDIPHWSTPKKAGNRG